jgi:gas vesicle protein
MNSGNVLLGVIAGAAIGASMGILFAPEKGVETRKLISKKGKEYAKEINEKYHGLVDSINEKIETGEQEATRIIKHKAEGEESHFTN